MKQNNFDLINFSQAARFLGYKSSAPIKKMVTLGKLTEYSVPDSTRKMIDRIELEALIKPIQISENNSGETESKKE
jgi:hypothetical protein